MEEEEEGGAKDEGGAESKKEFKLLSRIHQCILENEPEETAYCYLNRLIGPLSYQRAVELMIFYELKPEVMRAIVDRMAIRGIVELFCKILECECGKQFFTEYKYKYLALFFERLKKGLEEIEQVSWLEGLHVIYRFLTEKMEERCDYNKYLTLLEKVSHYEQGILEQINSSLACRNGESLLLSLRWIEELLKHDSYVMGQANVKLSITFMNRKDSISNNFYSDERVEIKRSYHISEPHLIQILQLCEQVDSKYLLSEERSGNRAQVLIAYYRVLYFFTRIWYCKAKDKKLSSPQLIGQFINARFLERTFAVVVNNCQSTSLHNCMKEIIIEGIREGLLSPSYFYQLEGRYAKLLLASFPRNRQNVSTPFSQQLYHIYKEVIVAEPHVSTLIEGIVLEHTQRMGKLIGGDPRKLHADSLRGSSNAFSESSENLDDMLEFDLHSQHSLGSSSKSFGMGVKVHNSTSIDRSGLSEVGEERIVIEGADDEDD
jgi:hypothetical protein